jgi:hypothetical protein
MSSTFKRAKVTLFHKDNTTDAKAFESTVKAQLMELIHDSAFVHESGLFTPGGTKDTAASSQKAKDICNALNIEFSHEAMPEHIETTVSVKNSEPPYEFDRNIITDAIDEMTGSPNFQLTKSTLVQQDRSDPKEELEYTDLMIDLETLSTEIDTAIVSIGYVFYNPDKQIFSPTRELFVDHAAMVKDGYHVSDSTLEWWKKKTGRAQEVFNSTDRLSIADALNQLVKDIKRYSSPEKVKPWGNGALFDIGAIGHAFRKEFGQSFSQERNGRISLRSTPYMHFSVRDVRTHVEDGLRFGLNPKYDMPFTGTPHNAADDALHQAKYCTAITQAMNKAALMYKNNMELEVELEQSTNSLKR